MCSLLILSPAKAVNQVDLAARRKESVPFDQVSVMILTAWPVTGRDAQVVPVVAQDHQTFPLGGRRDQQVSRARGPVLGCPSASGSRTYEPARVAEDAGGPGIPQLPERGRYLLTHHQVIRLLHPR